MNLLKENKKLIIGIIIGIIIASGITIYATINANAVDYTNNKKVSDALNELYQLTNGGQAETQINYGEFTTTTATHVNVGFRPNKVAIVVPYNRDACYVQYMYNFDNDNKVNAIWRVTNGDEGELISNYGASTIGFSVDNTGFNYMPPTTGSGYKTYWFATN